MCYLQVVIQKKTPSEGLQTKPHGECAQQCDCLTNGSTQCQQWNLIHAGEKNLLF